MSLKLRLLAAGGLVLAGFVALTAVALQRAVYKQAERAEEHRMQGLVYGLLGAINVDKNGRILVQNDSLPDQSFAQPDSGLYAVLLDAQGVEAWRSSSYLLPARDWSAQTRPAVGEWQFLYQESSGLFQLGFGLSWLFDIKSSERLYTLWVLKEGASFQQRLQSFGQTLWLWLGISAGLLIIVLILVLWWGLKPLRKLSLEMHAVELGKQNHITGSYPSELTPLAENVNNLLSHERQQQQRYRHALDDLAHSLKTPLAVLRGYVESPSADLLQKRKFGEHLNRINDIVSYQLRKAATAGKQQLRQARLLHPLLEKIRGALLKVYQDKDIDIRLDVPSDLSLSADKGDLMELAGNLLDNACKYGRTKVLLQAWLSDRVLKLSVDDDGPGFPDDAIEQLLQRGIRADSLREGQGIGLAVVQDIVSSYDGAVRLCASSLGGARVELELPC